MTNKSAEESYQNIRGKFQCDSCNHVTTRLIDLKAHKLAKHEGLVYNCDKCDLKTAYKSCLERHKFKHGEKKFSCDQCHFKATLSDILKVHQNTVHAGIKIKIGAICWQNNLTSHHKKFENRATRAF